MHYTTLCRLRRHCPKLDFNRLLNYLGKTEPDDAPLSLRTTLDANGITDAIRALDAIDQCSEKILFAVRGVRQSQHLLADPRSLNALDVAELYAIGEATIEELEAAQKEAWAAYTEAQDVWAEYDIQVAAQAAYAASTGCALQVFGWISMRDLQSHYPRLRLSMRQDFIDIFCS